MNNCAFSGKLLTQPVVSKKTGHVFEKEMIVKHIQSTGQCPVTGGELLLEDLIEVHGGGVIKPRSASSGNMTDILHKIQSEWDTLIMENFQIKKQLNEVREEISHNLYQHEAASLVICRLIKEKEEAVRQLNLLKSKLEDLQKDQEEEIEAGEEFDYMGIYNELVERIGEVSSQLTAKRKKREVPKELKTVEDLKQFKVKGSYPLHSSAKPGITCLDIHPVYDNLLVTGGVDSRAILFDTHKESALFFLDKGHSKRINSVKFYPSGDILGFAVASADNTASFWVNESHEELNHSNSQSQFSEKYKTFVHKGAITSASFHVLKEYCLFSSRDAHWSFHNLFKGVCLTKVKSESGDGISKCEIHPDGMIFGTGETNGLIRIWDLTNQTAVATIEGHKNEISGLSFSQNGYYLATSAIKESVVNIVDLRKAQIVKKIELPEGREIRSVTFDHSGSYLGMAGSSVNFYQVKSWSHIADFNEHTDIITDLKFSNNCTYFATTSLDRNLKIYSL